MIRRSFLRILVVFLGLVMIMTNLALSLDDETNVPSAAPSKGYPGEAENPLDILVDGEGGAHGDGFGWNVSFVGDLNNDGFEDLGVGAPFNQVKGANAGAVYIFFGAADADTWNNISATWADAVIYGQPGELFGWDLDGAGDMDNDGVDDLIVGAPAGGINSRGKVYIFNGSADFKDSSSATAFREYEGRSDWGSFGYSVTGCSDMNSDGFDDAAAGAPSVAQAAIFKGFQEQPPVYIDLWDDNPATANVTDFSIEVNNTPSDVNTFGIYSPPAASDDGWDWDAGIYAYGGDGTANVLTYYSPTEPGGPDTSFLSPNGRQEVGGFIQDMQLDSTESIAWGVQVNITTTLLNLVNSGYNAYFGFQWDVDDPSAGGTEEPVYVKARAGNSNNTMTYLGDNLDGRNYWMRYGGGGQWNNFIDPEPEIWHYRNPGAVLNGGNNFGKVAGKELLDVTRLINQTGPFYMDVGLLMYSGSNMLGTDEGLRGFFGNFSLHLERAENPVWIQGGGGFGWDVDGGLDINNDNRPDLIVSDVAMDPYSGNFNYRGTVYLYPGKANLDYVWYYEAADMFLGNQTWSYTGYSITMVPDMNGDGFDDIAAGAPFGDQVNIWYGRAAPPTPTAWFYAPWDDTPGVPENVTFETEVNNTASDINTFGIHANPSASDDGWDWDQGINVYGNTGTVATLNYYSAPEPGGSDTGIVPPRGDNTRIGATIVGIGTNDARGAAWGCQFDITNQMMNTINSGGMAYLYFNYEVWDRETAGGTEEPCYIKARAGHSNSTMTYLGGDMDGGGFWMWQGNWYWFSDPEPEVWHYRFGQNLGGGPNFGTDTGTAFLDLTDTIDGTGAFYIDLGILMRSGGNGVAATEGMAALFDTITIEFIDNVATPDVTIYGAPGERFGHSVAALDDINMDNLGDIIVGCPNANSTNGQLAGATYLFLGSSALPMTINASNGADFINHGEKPGDLFGFAVGGAASITGGQLSTPIVGSPLWQTPGGIETGKTYVLAIPPEPMIEVTYPNGGEVVNGTIVITGTAKDPNLDIDTAKGIHFALREEGTGTWVAIGATYTIGPGDSVSINFDTTSVPDGDYWVRANVTDLLGHFGQDMSDGYFTIDNPWNPLLNITQPASGESLNTTAYLKAVASDPDGLLNYTQGVTFYWSRDNGTTDPWKVAGVDNTTASGDTFNLTWDISALKDGPIYLNASVFDDEGLTANAYSGFIIKNPQYAPAVTITNPWNTSAELKGTVVINATVFDANGDILNSNITFFYSKEGAPWVEIGTAKSSRGTEFYQTLDTTTVEDGLYSFRVEAVDESGKMGFDVTPQFMVHNNVMNAPIVNILFPNGGEKFTQAGVITIKAYVFDLEDNIDTYGAKFYYSIDGENWTIIGNDGTGNNNIYEMPWDTTSMPDDIYWIKVNASDTDGNVGADTTNSTFIIHNKMDNPPRIRVIHPDGGEVLSGLVNVSVYAFDFENNIDTAGVVLHYSADDGENWEVFGSATEHTNNVYSVLWDTTGVPDGNRYLINATATDITLRKSFDTSNATFTIKNLKDSPPMVELLTPEEGDEVSGEINVTAYAFDLDADIVDVTFSARKFGTTEWTELGKDDAAEAGDVYGIVWNTSAPDFPNGEYLVKAEVVDQKGLNATDVLATTITINNQGSGPPPGENDPEVEITSPASGDSIRDSVTITVSASDLDGDLSSLEIYYKGAGGTRVLIDNNSGLSGETALVSADWDTNTTATPNGQYTITAVVTDENGNSAETGITVNVINQAGDVVPADDDDDDPEGFFAKFWWLFLILAALVLIIVVILVLLLVMRKKKVEVRIGSFELFGKPAEGRVEVSVDGREFSGGTDGEGIARIPDVDKNLMGREALVKCSFGDRDYEFKVILTADRVIRPPGDWQTKQAGGAPDEDRPKVEAKDETGIAKAVPDVPEEPAVARPEDSVDDVSVGMPPVEESAQISSPGEMKALPPSGEGTGASEDEKEDIDDEEAVGIVDPLEEMDEDDIDLDAEAPGGDDDDIQVTLPDEQVEADEEDEALKEIDTDAKASDDSPLRERSEDDIDLDKDISHNEVDIPDDDA